MASAANPHDELLEEIVNALTHGLGLILSVIGLVYLVETYWTSSGLAIASVSIFGATLVLTYGASTAYHAWPGERIKRWLRRVDHASIYLLIAGTYTPFTLHVLEPAWGLPVFGVVWGAAVLGAILKFVDLDRLPWSNRATYLAIGWLAVVVMYPLATTLSVGAFACLVCGGLAYTAGTLFYVWEEMPFNHGVWHLFVLGGSALHYWAVLLAAGV